MKVSMTGGTGFVGQEITRQLHSSRHSVRLLARDTGSTNAKEAVGKFGAELHAGNIVDSSTVSLAAALNGVQAIIHLIGIISEVGRSTFEKVHTWGTGNMVRAAQLAGVKRFIHMSALGTRPNAASRYHQTKWAAEEAVRQSGLDYTIFRPSLIYGPRDQFVNVFAKIIRLSPIVPVFGSPTAKFQPVSVEAVGMAFVRALAEPKAIGQTYDLCGPETFTLPQIIDEIMQVMERRRLKLHIPDALARCQAAVLEFIFPRLPHPKAPPLNRDQLTMLQEDNVGDTRPANELFGLQHPKFRDGIARYLKAGGKAGASGRT